MEKEEIQKAYLMRRHLLTHVKEEDSEVSVIGEQAEVPTIEPPVSVY